jgi:hypothetical protein
MGGVSDPVVGKTLSMYEFGRAAQLPLCEFAGQIAGSSPSSTGA